MSLSIMAQVNQVWDQISNFISNGRHHPITFSNDNYGFVISGSYLDDVYKYDKLNDTWSQLQNIPFNGRGYAYGVSSGNKAYMGFGSTSSGHIQLIGGNMIWITIYGIRKHHFLDQAENILQWLLLIIKFIWDAEIIIMET